MFSGCSAATADEYVGVVNRIAFPGFGWEFNIRETAIHNCFGIEGFDIQWYGIILSLGIVFAFLLFYRNAVKKELIDPDTVFNVTLLVVPIAIIGARFVYVVTEWDEYKGRSFFDMINIRAGGIAIYGAIIFGLATVFIYNKIKKTKSLAMLDALAPSVMLGQAIGRWGNFVNAEAYGWTENIDSVPWRMEIDNVVRKVFEDGERISRSFGVGSVHPTFFYESLWNFIGLGLIMFLLYRKKKFNGEIFCAYMGWYGVGRAIIECFRTDSLFIPGTQIKFSVVVGIIAFIGAIVLAVILYRKGKAEAEELAEYKSAYAAAKVATGADDGFLTAEHTETEDESETEVDSTEIDETEETADDDMDEDVEEVDEEVLAEQNLLDSDITEIQPETESEEE